MELIRFLLVWSIMWPLLSSTGFSFLKVSSRGLQSPKAPSCMGTMSVHSSSAPRMQRSRNHIQHQVATGEQLEDGRLKLFVSKLFSPAIQKKQRLARRVGRWVLSLVVCTLLVATMGGQLPAVASTTADAAATMAATITATAPTASAASAATATAKTITRTMEPALSAVWQFRLSLRLVVAALTGAAIGKERSGLRYHPAGVRTMSLVALGAALFTMCSRHGFAGTHYDTSRMASNVISGVGFIGAGVIYHEQKTEAVHGLTTATAIWISSAVGVACGTGLYVFAGITTLATLAILRIGGAVKLRKRNDRKRKKRKEQPISPSAASPSSSSESLSRESSSASLESTSSSSPSSSPSSYFPYSYARDQDEYPLVSRDRWSPPKPLSRDWVMDLDEEEARDMVWKNLKILELWSNTTRDGPAP